MEIVFQPKAYEDIKYWKSINNQTILDKISKLLASVKVNPYQGIGKPEPLKHKMTGMWSRRINEKHRLVYRLRNDVIMIYSLKDHY